MTAEPTPGIIMTDNIIEAIGEIKTPRTDAVEHRFDTALAVEPWEARCAYDLARQLERELSLAKSRLAEVEKDAERYNKLKAAITVPMAMQSFLKHMNWHPDTFKMGIDEAIDAAIKRSSAPAASK